MNQYVLYNLTYLKFGITTNAYGFFDAKELKLSKKDFSNSDEIKKSLQLANGIGASIFYKIIPEHSDEIIFTDNELNGKYYYPLCDGIIHIKKLAKKNTAIFCNSADCPIVVIYHKYNLITGLIHSGWRGTQKEILPKAIKKIQKLNINLDDLIFFIWPGICGDCYNIGEEFNNIFPNKVINGKLNLKNIITEQLIYSSINELNIASVEYCSFHTAENGAFLFASYRRDSNGYRNAVFVV